MLMEYCFQCEDGVVAPTVSLGRVRYTPSGLLPSHCLSFTPDSKTLVSATNAGTVQLIKVDSIQPSITGTITLPDGMCLLDPLVNYHKP